MPYFSDPQISHFREVAFEICRINITSTAVHKLHFDDISLLQLSREVESAGLKPIDPCASSCAFLGEPFPSAHPGLRAEDYVVSAIRSDASEREVGIDEIDAGLLDHDAVFLWRRLKNSVAAVRAFEP